MKRATQPAGQFRSAQETKRTLATARYWTRRLGKVDSLAAVLTYDAPAAINRAYDNWERGSLLRYLPASLERKTALDLGCGTGRISLLLAGAGARVTGVDICPAMLAACRREARRARLAERITLIECPVHKLPPDLGRFDIITCFGLLEHLPPTERRQCLIAALAGLKKRGRMMVVVNNADNIYLRNRNTPSRREIEGHYVSMVGLAWLENFCRSHGAKLILRAANPFYGWLHYGVLKKGTRKTISRQQLEQLAELVSRLDPAFPIDGPLPFKLASHFLVEIQHR